MKNSKIALYSKVRLKCNIEIYLHSNLQSKSIKLNTF